MLAAAGLALRRWQRAWLASDVGLNLPLPGDDHVAEPSSQLTRAITIDARPEEIWPWIVQLGADRGGFYSYDWLENLFGLGIHSAEEIVPEWQERATGDLVHADRAGTGGWYVVELRPNDTLSMKVANVGQARPLTRDEGAGWEFLWTFALRPLGDGGTRLLVREKVAFGRRLTRWWMKPVGLVSFVMTPQDAARDQAAGRGTAPELRRDGPRDPDRLIDRASTVPAEALQLLLAQRPHAEAAVGPGGERPASTASGFGVGGATRWSVLRSMWWNGSARSGDLHDALLLVRPRAVVVDRDVDPVADRAEVVGRGTGSTGCRRLSSRAWRVSSNSVASGSAGPGASSTWARGMASVRMTALGGRLPEPVPDLVVERLDLARLDDVGVVAQAVEELRPVRLGVDRLQLVALDERVSAGAVGDGMLVGALRALPDARHRRQRAEVGQRVRVALGLGVDVLAVPHEWATVAARSSVGSRPTPAVRGSGPPTANLCP